MRSVGSRELRARQRSGSAVPPIPRGHQDHPATPKGVGTRTEHSIPNGYQPLWTCVFPIDVFVAVVPPCPEDMTDKGKVGGGAEGGSPSPLPQQQLPRNFEFEPQVLPFCTVHSSLFNSPLWTQRMEMDNSSESPCNVFVSLFFSLGSSSLLTIAPSLPQISPYQELSLLTPSWMWAPTAIVTPPQIHFPVDLNFARSSSL